MGSLDIIFSTNLSMSFWVYLNSSPIIAMVWSRPFIKHDLIATFDSEVKTAFLSCLLYTTMLLYLLLLLHFVFTRKYI